MTNLNRFKPPGYPAFTEENVSAANPNNLVMEMLAGSDGSIYADDSGYTLDFGAIYKPLIGVRWRSADFRVINQVPEPGDSLDASFDISAAAPFLTTGFAPFSGLATGDSIGGFKVEISTQVYGAGVLEGEIVIQPVGLVDTGARMPLDALSMNMTMEIWPSVYDIVADLSRNRVRTKGNQVALLNFLRLAAAAAEKGNLDQATRKLEQALERTDGCVLRGTPDNRDVVPLAKDYITDCSDQELVYALIIDELNALAPGGGSEGVSYTVMSYNSDTTSSGGGSLNPLYIVVLFFPGLRGMVLCRCQRRVRGRAEI